MNLTVSSRRVQRVLAPLVLTGVVALGVTACSGEDDKSSSGSASSSASSDAKNAGNALNAGLAAHADGDLTTAAKKYDEVLTTDPTNKFALYNLALIDAASSNYGLAEEKYRKALVTDPAYEPALFNLAILVTSSDPEEAVSLYQRAVKSNEKDASAWMNLGLLLRASGGKAAGDQAVQRAITLNPDLSDPAVRSAS